MEKLGLPQEEVEALVKELADSLNETTRAPIKQIRKIIDYFGPDFARQVYKETLEVEANGGLMLPNGERRRTIGGVFFFLSREKMTDEQRPIIFPPFKQYKGSRSELAPIGVPLLNWSERIALIDNLKNQQGEVKSMKVTLSGRPGSVEKQGDIVVTTLSDTASVSNLPRPLPRPPETPTLYTVYMVAKQWEKVEASMADPADNLIVDGVCAFDPETQSMAVFATGVRSELLDIKPVEKRRAEAAAAKQAKQQAKTAKAEAEKVENKPPKAKSAPPAQAQGQNKNAPKPRVSSFQAEPEQVSAAPLNPKFPPDVARKLNELHASASLFRQKVANLQSKPPGQQFGLEMTQKLLKNVEDEIASLEKKHGG